MILINAQANRSEKLGVFAKYVPLQIPIGIAVLAAFLINKGYNVKIWDDAVRMLTSNDLKELIKGCGKPYIFGISCMTASIARGLFIAKNIRKLFPDAKIVFGGIHPTVLPEETIKSDLVDFVVRKEGEIPMEQLYVALKTGSNFEDIPNLSFKKNGRIIHNEPMPGPSMEELPPFPYSLFEEHQDKYDLGFVIGSRGCPYDCIFCSQRSITGRRVSDNPAERIVADIELLVNKYHKELITFADDSMLTNKKRILTMCEMIIKKGLHKKASFQGQVRGDDCNAEVLKGLKNANFITLSFGLETASERLMEIIEKQETVAANVKAMEMARQFGFQISGTFILGLPTETKEERRESYKLACKYLDFVRFNDATPYPGTKFYEIALKDGRMNIGKEWENFNACGTLIHGVFNNRRLAYVPIGSTEAELKLDLLRYNLFFSFRWKVISDLLFKKRGTAGWFSMKQRWFLDFQEWIHLIILGVGITKRWVEMFIFMFIASLPGGNRSLPFNKQNSGSHVE